MTTEDAGIKEQRRKAVEALIDAAGPTCLMASAAQGAKADTARQSGDAKHALVAGGAAGDITVTAIKAVDKLDEVIYFVGAGVAVTDISDLTAEFTISADGKINNTAGTASTGGKLLVRWTKKAGT